MNPNHIKLVKALLTGVVTSEIVLGRLNRKRCDANVEKIDLLNEQKDQLSDALHASFAQTEYLIEKLNAAGVEADEFDLIVINSLIQ